MMVIKLSHPGVVELEGEKTNVIVSMTDNKHFSPDAMNVGPFQLESIDENQRIEEPGEYERGDVSAVVLDKQGNEPPVGQIYNIGLEGINVMFIKEYVDVDADDIETLGKVDVLCLDIENTGSQIESLLKKFDPYVLLAYNYGDTANLEKVTGITPEAVDSKFKLKHSEFTADDFSLRLLAFNK